MGPDTSLSSFRNVLNHYTGASLVNRLAANSSETRLRMVDEDHSMASSASVVYKVMWHTRTLPKIPFIGLHR